MDRPQSGSEPDRWASARKIIEDMKRVGAVPDSDRPDGVVQTPEFSGHKGIYLANLEGCLGGSFPALLAERDALTEALTEALDALEASSHLGPTIPEQAVIDRGRALLAGTTPEQGPEAQALL